MSGADDVCPVAGADTGRHGSAVLQDEGVVIGGKTGSLDLAAHGGVCNILGGGDIAVDEHPGHIALGVADQDGLDQAVGHLNAGDIALEGDELAQDGAVIHLGGGDHLGLYGGIRAQLPDLGHGQLALALVGAGGAADAELIADLIVAGHGEAVDAAGLVLDIDAVKEGGILIIAGGVGGDDALHGVLDALIGVRMDFGDGADLGGIEIVDQVLADPVVGVVLLQGVVQVGLDLEIREEGRTGDDDHALALQLLGGHDQQAGIVLGVGVLGDACAASAVLIHVHGVGAGVAVDHRGDGGRQGRGGIARSIHGIDGGAAVVAEALGVHLVVGMVGVYDHTVREEVIHVVVAEVEPPLIHAVGGAANIIVGSIVADAEAGAQGLQHIVLGLGHVLGIGVILDDIVVLVVVAPAGQDDCSPSVIKGRQGCELLLAVGLGIGLGLRRAAAGGGEDHGLILGVGAGGDEVRAGVQLDGAHAVLRGQIAEVAHAVLIVAVYILIIMRGIDADVDQLAGIQHIQADGLGEGVVLVVLIYHGGDQDGGNTGLVGGPLKGNVQGAAGGDGVAGCVGADDLAVDAVDQGGDGGVGILAVKESGGQGQLLVGDGGGGAADQVGDAQLQALAHPHGGGDSQVAVLLGDADEVVAVLWGQGDGESAALELGRIVPNMGHLAGVDHHLHLGDGIRAVGIVNADLDVQLAGHRLDAGAHHETVDGVAQLQVLILGGIHTQGADGVVDALLGKVIGEDNVAGIVGIAPLALMVILVVGGGQVPALIQRHDVLLIAGIVAAGADLTLAVTHLHHVHAAVDDGIPIAEILEVAEGGAGVVKLADGVCALGLAQQGVIGLHAGVIGLIIQGLIVAGDDAGGIEGVDMAGTAGPGHLEAADGHHVAGVVLVELGDGVLVGLPAVVGIGILDQRGVIEGGLHIGVVLGIEIVGVVGEGHELDVGAVGQVLDIAQGAVQRAGAIGILGVAVELAEVELVGGLAHGEEPAEFGRLAVGPGSGDLHLGAAVSHVSGGGIGDAAASILRSDGGAVHGHGDGGSLPGIGQSHGNGGTLILAGLAAPGGGGIGKDGFVLNGDLSGGGDGNVLIVRATDVHGELIARDGGGGDGDGVGAVLAQSDAEGCAIELGGHVTLHAEGGVHGEGEGIVRAHIGIGQVAQDHGGVIHDTVHSLSALRYGVEEEGVDGVVGDIIHGIDLEAVTVILQPLTMALVLGGAALHLVAAYAAGAGTHQPIGIIAGGGAIKSVVAGAARAEVAVGLVIEAVVVAVFLHLEHHGAVGAGSLAILNGGGGLVDGGAGCIIVLRSQDSLGILIVDDHLVAHGGEAAGGGRRCAGNIVGAAAVAELIGGLICRAAAVHGGDVRLGHAGGQRHPLKEVGAAGYIGDGGVAGGVIGTQRHILDINVLAEIVLAHLRNCDLLGRNGLHAGLYDLHGGERHLGYAVIRSHGAGDLHDVAHLVLGVIRVVINLEAVDLAVNNILQNDGVDAGFIVIGVAVVIHYLADHRDIRGGGGNGSGLLHGDGTGGDHIVGNGINDGSGGADLIGQGVAQLERTIEGTHGGGDIHHVSHGEGPLAVLLLHDGLVELDGLAVGVLQGDIGAGVYAVVVVDLGDLQTLQLHIAAHILVRKSADGGGLSGQGQPGGLFEGAVAQLGQLVVFGALTGAVNGVAQGDLTGLGAKTQADAAGGVLQVDVLPVHQGHNALNGEVLAVFTGQCLADGHEGGLGVGGLAAGVDHQVELLGEQGLVSGADGGLRAEVALVGIPLEGVAADDILDVEAALGGGGGDGPLGVYIIQGNAGIAGTHGELLAIGGGKGILAVLDAQGPQLGIAVAGELIGAIQRHIHTGAVKSGYRCGGHGLFDRGVEYDHRVAILQGGQVGDDAALTGGGDLQPIDAGQQHAHVGGRGVVQEPGRLDVVQDAAAGRIRAGHSGQSAVVNGDGPCTGSLAGVVQRLGISGIDLLAVGRGERPLAGLAAQREDFHGICRVSGVGFDICEKFAG